jgi:hypothetical protein
MNKLVIASMDKSAGKTSVIVGIGKALGKSMGYMKPFGDRLFYRKKRSWDYDSSVISTIFGLDINPEDMSMGFDHSKLKFMYDEKAMKEKLVEMSQQAGKGKDFLFIETGRNLAYGAGVNLEPMSVSRSLGAKLAIVVSGDETAIMDDISFIRKYLGKGEADLKGVIINKVRDIEDFRNTYLKQVTDMGIRVLGLIPYQTELTFLSVQYLMDRLFAKVIAGERGLNRFVNNIFIGAMSADAALRNPAFNKENMLLLTSGDRSDMILAALEGNTACVIMTNNILPPSNIISKAEERNIPLLLVSYDTFETAKQIDSIEPLLTKDDNEKIRMLGQLAEKNISLNDLASS